MVYTGTHDNSTSKSWWNCLDKNVKTQLNDDYKLFNNPSWDLMEIGMKTKANLFIAPIQDILSLDDSCRLNKPGTIKNNWRWKLNKPLEDIEEKLKEFSELGKICGRIND